MIASAQVRQRIVALLANATDAGGRVTSGRPWPLAADQLPAIKVATTGENVTSSDVHYPRLQEHELELEARAFVRDLDDPDAALDVIAEQLVHALLGDEDAATLAPLPNCDMELRGFDRQFVPDGEAATAAVAVRIAVTFQTLANDPSTLV